MGVQFGRKVIAIIGERNGEKIKIRNLRMSFQIEKTTKSDPNRATFTVYNLNENSRAKLEEAAELFLSIEAGYGDETKVIFSGDVDKIENKKTPTDWVTIVETGDGKKDLTETRLNKSYKKGTSVKTVIDDALSAFTNLKNNGLPDGLIQSAKELVTGGTFSGKSKDVLDKLLGEQGLEFSVQDDEVVITEKDKATNNDIYIINPNSGLINSPAKTEEKNKEGKVVKGVTFTALLNPNLVPKQRVRVESRNITVEYTIIKINHVGDSQQGTFYTQVEDKE